MADVLSFDLIEEILVRLSVLDLLRFKSVCKSWYSLILSPLFAKAHLNHTSNKDKVNAHRRVVAITAALSRIIPLLMRYRYFRIVGSSNGLLCIYCDHEEFVAVANPATRVAQKLQTLTQKPKRALLCYGFGYDSSRDDYKVIVGFRKRKMTHFYLLSLESNVWKFIGEVNCKFINHRNGGILCHGSLNWLMKDKNKKVILSFDLSKQEFNEILLPDNPMKYIGNRLGVYKECLCIYNDRSPSKNKWLLENWNVKESWKLMQSDIEAHFKGELLLLRE